MLTQIDVIYGTDVNAVAWVSTTSYFKSEQVVYLGITYEALVANTNNVPNVAGSTFWRPSEKALALPILGVTPKDSLLVNKVTGLSPPDIDLFIGEFARDGGMYQGRRVKERNVVVTLDLNPNPALGETISGLRDMLYKIFVDPLVNADYLELVLRDDAGRVRNLHGYVEKFETEIFAVETMTQISLICPDPYIRDLAETVLTNTSGTWVSVPFTYGGTAETGFFAEIHVSATTSTLTLRNNGQAMVITHPFVAGDIVYVNTKSGERDVTFTRGGVSTPLLAKLSNNSTWLELHAQANTMNVYGALPANQIAGIKSIAYRASYWGV